MATPYICQMSGAMAGSSWGALTRAQCFAAVAAWEQSGNSCEILYTDAPHDGSLGTACACMPDDAMTSGVCSEQAGARASEGSSNFQVFRNQRYTCETGSGIACKSCVSPQSRLAQDHCETRNDGFQLAGYSCTPAGPTPSPTPSPPTLSPTPSPTLGPTPRPTHSTPSGRPGAWSQAVCKAFGDNGNSGPMFLAPSVTPAGVTGMQWFRQPNNNANATCGCIVRSVDGGVGGFWTSALWCSTECSAGSDTSFGPTTPESPTNIGELWYVTHGCPSNGHTEVCVRARYFLQTPSPTPCPPDPSGGCQKWDLSGWYDGAYNTVLQPWRSPNGNAWTWAQCAAECAMSATCEFWALQLNGNQKGLSMSNIGDYRGAGGHYSGVKMTGCAPGQPDAPPDAAHAAPPGAYPMSSPTPTPAPSPPTPGPTPSPPTLSPTTSPTPTRR
ncbi:unnamed protein product [Prorocentrum cordatum]|uniref:Cellulase n=1 Tax=Prorocentrum cordatum TaxID=2364126 RepID=A0ABN9T4I5_9DINO|nr:unnamed protein product [Polarella glacialis]